MGITIQKPEISGDDKIQEKGAKIMVAHKLKVSALSIAILAFSAFAGLPPFSWLYSIGGPAGKALIMILVAQVLAFYPSRIVHRRLGSKNYDLIYVENPSDQRRAKLKQYAKGKFKDKYEFKWGRPLSWENKAGTKCYSVIELNDEENIAYCSYLGDYDQAEILAFEEAWKEQRLKNDKERRAGAEIRMKSGQIVSKMRSRISNAWLRDLQEVEHDQDMREEMESLLPDSFQEDLDLEEDLLEDLEKQAEDPKTLEIADREDE